MKKEITINETEARAIIHEALSVDGIKITKTLLDQVLDKSKDMAIAGLAKGVGIKMQGLGTIEVRTHQERTRKVPVKNADGTWGTNTVTTPAGRHVALEVSDKLMTELNATV